MPFSLQMCAKQWKMGNLGCWLVSDHWAHIAYMGRHHRVHGQRFDMCCNAFCVGELLLQLGLGVNLLLVV
jgi:hypothetical protein